MNEQTETTRFRSPPFPAMPLQRAVERAEQLYRQERDHPVPVASAARAWGMSPTSSGPIQTVGALRQYGLVEDESTGPTRKIKLTHDALRIILDRVPTSDSRREALRRAFFSAKIFAELWERWHSDLPSNQTMINYLVLERRLSNQAPFSEQAASELLANYRASLSFASIEDAPTVSPSATETEEMATMDSTPAREAQSESHGHSTFSARPSAPSAPMKMATERVVFVEEGEPNQYLKLTVSGDLDEILLDALSDYVTRQKRRLNRPN
jgi:hypothetical protein